MALIDFAFEEQKRKYIQKFQRYYPELHAAEVRAAKQDTEIPLISSPTNGYARNTELMEYRKSLGSDGYSILSAETQYSISALQAFEYGHRRTPDYVMEYIRANPAPQPNNL